MKSFKYPNKVTLKKLIILEKKTARTMALYTPCIMAYFQFYFLYTSLKVLCYELISPVVYFCNSYRVSDSSVLIHTHETRPFVLKIFSDLVENKNTIIKSTLVCIFLIYLVICSWHLHDISG